MPNAVPGTRITYRQISEQEYYSSRFSWCVKRLSILVVWALQGLPLTPNMFTSLSTLLAASAAAALAFAGSVPLFILLSALTFVFDQVDGTWARLKGQSTAFGRFYDPFTDALKFALMDIGLLLHGYDRLLAIAGDQRVLLALTGAHFAVRELYSMSAPAPAELPAPRRGTNGLSLGLAGSAARYWVFFPLAAAVPALLPWYFLGSMTMHAGKTAQFVLARLRADAPAQSAKVDAAEK